MEPVGLPTSGPTGSALSHLEGALSGRIYEADRLIGLDVTDGKPLLARPIVTHARLARKRLKRRAEQRTTFRVEPAAEADRAVILRAELEEAVLMALTL